MHEKTVLCCKSFLWDAMKWDTKRLLKWKYTYQTDLLSYSFGPTPSATTAVPEWILTNLQRCCADDQEQVCTVFLVWLMSSYGTFIISLRFPASWFQTRDKLYFFFFRNHSQSCTSESLKVSTTTIPHKRIPFWTDRRDGIL